MAKRRITFTQKLLERWLKEGRGSGEGEFYKPWLTIHDFASIGRSHRIPDWQHGRLRHLMSDLEEIIFYLLSWNERVTDIREQFPLLPLEETLWIAEELGIKHPADPISRFPIVMTTDFLLKTKSEPGDLYVARTVKPGDHLNNPRIVAKFAIERRYWKTRNVDWGIITDHKLPLQLYRNIKLVYEWFSFRSLKPLTIQIIDETTHRLTNLVIGNNLALRDISQIVDKQFGFMNGTAMNVVRHLIARRQWQINMYQPIEMSKPLALVNHYVSKANLGISANGGNFHD